MDYPESRFVDQEFTVSLISHFLFMYDEQLDWEFYEKTLLEIIRITSREIRIFPLVNLKGKRSSLVDQLVAAQEFGRYRMEIKKVVYEFVRGGDEMLLISLD